MSGEQNLIASLQHHLISMYVHTYVYCIAGNIGRKNIWRFWTDLNIGSFNFGGYNCVESLKSIKVRCKPFVCTVRMYRNPLTLVTKCIILSI